MELIQKRNKATMGFTNFNNWTNEFDIKVERLICDELKAIPINIHLIFPMSDYEQIMEFGVGFIIKICHYLYVVKHNGHEKSVINIDFM